MAKKGMKRVFVIVMLCCMALSMVGCEKKERLYVFNWGIYIDPEVYEIFEKEYNIKVVANYYETNEEMYPVIKMGGQKYDVVCPSDYMIEKMIQEDLLYELDFDNIPNIRNIDEVHLRTSEGFDPGNKYSVPYFWGTVGILYNAELVYEPVDSWGAIFDERYSGKIYMMDSVRDAFMVALKYLGYDGNSTNMDEIDEARDLLKRQYSLVQGYFIDQVREKMIAEEGILGVIYSGEAVYTKSENPNLEYVVPKEGSNVWIDSWVIPKNANNKEAAEKWINFLCRADIALMNFEFVTYSSPNKLVRDLVEDEELRNNPVAFPDKGVLDRCSNFKYLGEEWEEIYLTKWNEVK